MKVIIDGDIFRYEIGAIELDNPYCFEGTMPASPSQVQNMVDDKIENILAACEADEYIVVLSGKGNFRTDIAKQQEYKGNRKDMEKPYNWSTVGNHIIAAHPHIVVDGYEADDWIGINQLLDVENSIIASRDKDLKTVYGWHYRWQCGERQPEQLPHWIDQFQARHFFFYQMLIGDNTDNICGCGQKKEVKWGGEMKLRRKGIGPKAAEQILADCNTVQELYDAVSQCYQNEFGDNWEEVMLENARLLFIGQTPDHLFEWDWLDYELKKEGYNDDSVSSEGTGTQCECSDQPTSD